MGFGIDRQQLKAKAARLAVSLRLKTPFKNGVPGDDWVNGFLKRNAISLRCQVALSTVRSRMLNRTITEKYFGELVQTISNLNLTDKPNCIWNMDETSICLTHKPTRVFASKGARNVPGRVGNSRESITVTACINAAGSDVPPMVVVRGKTKKSLNAFNVAEGPFGTQWTYQTKGWMEETLGTEWFKGVFVPNIGIHRPQILILDSHSSHETLDIIECANAENITLFALPPHTTQWLNPLDKTVFGPFSKEYNRRCTEFMSQSPNNLVCKWVWPSLFKYAYEKTFTKHNITKGFSTCGIYPTGVSSIPDSAFMPSNAFDRSSDLDTAATSSDLIVPTTNSTEETMPNTDEVPDPLVAAMVMPSQDVQDANGTQLLGTADENGTLTLESVTAEDVLEAIITSGMQVNVDSTGSVLEHTDTASVHVHPTESSASPMDMLMQTVLQSPMLATVPPATPALPLDVQSSSATPALLSTSEEIDLLFKLPRPKCKPESKSSKRKLTSHRVVTSDEIVREKEEIKRRKEEETRKKEERKIARLVKQEEKKMKETMKKQTKKLISYPMKSETII